MLQYSSIVNVKNMFEHVDILEAYSIPAKCGWSLEMLRHTEIESAGIIKSPLGGRDDHT